MKRLLLLILVFAMLGGSVQAQDALTDLLGYFPDDTDVAMSFRIDDGYLETLDTIWGLLQDKIPAVLNPPDMTLRQALDETLAAADLSLVDLRMWLGDHAAIAVLDAVDPVPLAIITAEITNRREAEVFFENILRESGDEYSRRPDDTYSIYVIESGTPDMVLAISDAVMILASDADFAVMTSSERGLTDSIAVRTAMAGLPAESYNLVGYTDAEAMNQMQGLPPVPGMDATLVFGLTILDATVLVADIAQVMNTPPALPAVDPAFIRFVPPNAVGVLHSADLTTSFDLLVQQPGFTQRDLDQLEGSLGLLGIDLRDDILSWTTGEYLMYGGFDVAALLQLVDNPALVWETLPLDAGLVIEVTDPERALNLVNKLETVLSLLAASQPEITFAPGTLAGRDVLTLTIDVPLAPAQSMQAEVMVGANDDVFFVATAPAARTMFNSLLGLYGNRAFHEAAPYFLPDSTSVVYADGDGLTASTVMVLALLGPTIGNIFEDIIDELEQGEQIQAQRVSYRAQDPDEIRLVIEAARAMFTNATITSAYTDKLLLTRFTLQVAD